MDSGDPRTISGTQLLKSYEGIMNSSSGKSSKSKKGGLGKGIGKKLKGNKKGSKSPAQLQTLPRPSTSNDAVGGTVLGGPSPGSTRQFETTGLGTASHTLLDPRRVGALGTYLAARPLGTNVGNVFTNPYPIPSELDDTSAGDYDQDLRTRRPRRRRHSFSDGRHKKPGTTLRVYNTYGGPSGRPSSETRRGCGGRHRPGYDEEGFSSDSPLSTRRSGGTRTPNGGKSRTGDSLPLVTPRTQELRRLADQQTHLEERVEVQQNQYSELMTTMKDQEGAAREERELSQQQAESQQELIRNLKKRAEVLEEDNAEMRRQLQEARDRLEAELQADTRDKRKLKSENDVLKETTHRLSVELSRWQVAYKPPDRSQVSDSAILPADAPTPTWLVQPSFLSPLFHAYDERLAEKDDVITSSERALGGVREQVEQMARENLVLYDRLEVAERAGPRMPENLEHQIRLALEENQVLVEQMRLQAAQQTHIHQEHVAEVSKLNNQLSQTEASRNRLESEVDRLKTEVTSVESKTTHVTTHFREQHESDVAEMKRVSEVKEEQHQREVNNFTKQIKGVQKERERLRREVEEVTSHLEKTQQMCRTLKRENKSHVEASAGVKAARAALQQKEREIQDYLQAVLKVAESAVKERDELGRLVQKTELERRKAVEHVKVEALAICRVRDKLKNEKAKTKDIVTETEDKIRTAEGDWSAQRHEYDREILHLRQLVTEKDYTIEALTGEKRDVEDDLETVWVVGKRENRRMQESVQKQLRQLRSTTGMDLVSADQDLDVSEDSDHPDA